MFDFRFNTPTIFPESGSRKRFHVSGMRAIDFSHKITSRKVIFAQIKKIFLQKIARKIAKIHFFFGHPVAKTVPYGLKWRGKFEKSAIEASPKI